MDGFFHYGVFDENDDLVGVLEIPDLGSYKWRGKGGFRFLGIDEDRYNRFLEENPREE
jgi:hypothetical protein